MITEMDPEDMDIKQMTDEIARLYARIEKICALRAVAIVRRAEAGGNGEQKRIADELGVTPQAICGLHARGKRIIEEMNKTR